MSERNERADFSAAVKAMLRVINNRPRSYMGRGEAEPYVANLPEFWREPARVMANVGYYAGADEWMAQHGEDEDVGRTQPATKEGGA